jgi:hypothetical protein
MIEDIKKTLWATEYKHIVLGPTFGKYISDARRTTPRSPL